LTMDLHRFEERFRREIERIKASDIAKENKELILAFQRDLVIEGIGIPRIHGYMRILRLICEWKDKPFGKWSVDDLKEVLLKIETNGYTQETIKEFRKTLRKFFKWLKGEDWKGLKVLKGKRTERELPEVLTEDEILAMIEAANHPRDKAMIAVDYEAGLRIGELAGLKVKDITWNEHGAKIKVKGKTGERQIPIVMAAPYLKRWLELHPAKDNPNAIVFIGIGTRNRGEPIGYKSFEKAIKKAAEKAGIKKRIHPHILRHSRATVLANFLTEAQMCEYFGWVQGSSMARIYVHLSGRDIDKAINRVYGIEEEEEEKEIKLRPQKCHRCSEINPPAAKFCYRCGLILDEKERLRAQFDEAKVMPSLMTKILEDEQLREKFKAILQLMESLEGNAKAMELLQGLVSEITKS